MRAAGEFVCCADGKQALVTDSSYVHSVLSRVTKQQLKKLPKIHAKAWNTIKKGVEAKGAELFRVYKVKSHRKDADLVGQSVFEVQKFKRNLKADEGAVAAAKRHELPAATYHTLLKERQKAKQLQSVFVNIILARDGKVRDMGLKEFRRLAEETWSKLAETAIALRKKKKSTRGSERQVSRSMMQNCT